MARSSFFEHERDVALREIVQALEFVAAYDRAIERGYLWHEFSDVHLIV